MSFKIIQEDSSGLLQETGEFLLPEDFNKISLLTTGTDTTASRSSTATASITPLANRVLVAWIYSIRSTGTNSAPTASGNGLTWTALINQNGVTANRLTVFYAATGSSPSAGAVTFSFPVGFITDGWGVLQLEDSKITGTNGVDAIVQSNTASATGSSTATPTADLSAFADSNNCTLGIWTCGSGQTLNPESGYIKLVQSTVIADTMAFSFKPSSDTTPTGTWGAATTNRYSATLEISTYIDATITARDRSMVGRGILRGTLRGAL